MTVYFHVPPNPLVNAAGVIAHPLQRPSLAGGVLQGAGTINPAAFRSVFPNPKPLGNFPAPTTVVIPKPTFSLR